MTAAPLPPPGPWISTATGGRFDLVSPEPGMIHIGDIAVSLSRIPRWNGHTATDDASTVAEHCVRVSWLLCDISPENQLWGLLHDAAEAYLGDVTRPLKALLPYYRATEDRVMRIVAARFDLPWPMPPEVKTADELMLAWEGRDYMIPAIVTPWSDNDFFTTGAGARQLPAPWPARIAQGNFLDRFTELAGDWEPEPQTEAT